MHLRGKDFTLRGHLSRRQEGSTLLSVPRYDFNWQSNYRLEKPLRLPAGTQIDCTAHFDNSADNPNNPDREIAGALGRPDVGRDDDRLRRLRAGSEGRQETRREELTKETTRPAARH